MALFVPPATTAGALLDLSGPVSLEQAAHAVQLALTPVFLLSGIAALLNVFASRLARVSDQTNAVVVEPRDALGRGWRLRNLHGRSIALQWAVLLAALGGALTCGAILLLFLGALLGRSAASLLFGLFGGAVVLTAGSLVAFVAEMLMASRSVRERLAHNATAPSEAGDPA